MRAIGLVLLSIAIRAAHRRAPVERAREPGGGPQKAGARPIPVRASTTTAAIPRSTSAIKRPGLGGFAAQSVSGNGLRDRLHLGRGSFLGRADLVTRYVSRVWRAPELLAHRARSSHSRVGAKRVR